MNAVRVAAARATTVSTATASSAPAALVGRSALLSTSTAAGQLASSLRMSVPALARTHLASSNVVSPLVDVSVQRVLNFCTTSRPEEDAVETNEVVDDAEGAVDTNDAVDDVHASNDTEADVEAEADDVTDANADDVAQADTSEEEEIISVDMHTRYVGKVKWFRGDLGYGFVTADFGAVKKDIFVHYSQIRGEKMRGFRALWEDLEVEFQIDEDVNERMHCRKVSLPGGVGVPEPPPEEMERIEHLRQKRFERENGRNNEEGRY